MIPPTYSEEHTSSGEVLVFNQFQKLELPGASCYHSFRLSEHSTKPTSEIDFVVLLPEGLLVVEVKSGGVHRDANGQWLYEGRQGTAIDKKGGPFRQAETAMWALRDLLIKQIGNPAVNQMPMGWAVSFPHVKFTESSPEWKAWQVHDRRHLATASSSRFLRKCIQEWQKILNKNSPPKQLLETFQATLRSEFHVVPSLASEALHVKEECHRLTNEQKEALELLDSEKRLIITGGAGTGKTVLAVETARTTAAAGKRVVLLVPSRRLTKRLNNHQQTKAIEIREFVKRPYSVDKADVLIIDEAQDVLDNSGVQIMEDWVQGGLIDGEWRIFLDENIQADLVGRFDSAVFDYLKETASANPRLKKNCRNTTQVVQHIQALTGADVGVPTVKEGTGVKVRWPRNSREEASLLEDHLRHLLGQGSVPPGDITILTSDPNNSCIHLLPEELKTLIERFTEAFASLETFPTITLATPEEFKGFENSYVCMVDAKGIGRSDQEVSALYVGLSRAQAGLWLTFPLEAKPDIEQAIEKNFSIETGDS